MKTPLRVLVIRNAYQQDAGGAEQYALNLAVALKQAGHTPYLVTKVKNILDKAAGQNIETIPAVWHDAQGWDRSYYFRYPLTVIWYMFIILTRRIDVVHPQSRDDFVFATRAAQLLHKRIIWTDHADLKHILDNVNHFNPRMRGWVVAAAKHAAAITCVSNSEAKAIVAVGPDIQKPRVVHNGVFVPKNIVPAKKAAEHVIGTNARLVPDKGIAELIAGFAAVKAPSKELWLLGGVSGNKRMYEELAAKLGVKQQVKIIDYVSNPNDYMAAMDIFVHASYHEGLSLAIIEAAMLGRPIVATRVGGTPEILNDSSAILIEPKDAGAITNALQQLLDSPSLAQKLAAAAQKRALQDFDFTKIVERKIIPLYQGEN